MSNKRSALSDSLLDAMPDKTWTEDQLGEYVKGQFQRNAQTAWKIGHAVNLVEPKLKKEKLLQKWCKKWMPYVCQRTIDRYREVARKRTYEHLKGTYLKRVYVDLDIMESDEKRKARNAAKRKGRSEEIGVPPRTATPIPAPAPETTGPKLDGPLAPAFPTAAQRTKRLTKKEQQEVAAYRDQLTEWAEKCNTLLADVKAHPKEALTVSWWMFRYYTSLVMSDSNRKELLAKMDRILDESSLANLERVE
jgi:hypothetical protein